MHTMEYTDQTSGAIRLYLSRGDFNIDQFILIKEYTLEHNGITIRFGILGESHFIRFEKDGEVLNEICACVDAHIENPEQLIAHDFLPNLHTIPVAAAFSGHMYSFTFTYADWHHGEELLTTLRNTLSENTRTLTHVFPKHDTIDHEAVTELYLTLDETVTLKSVHTYPNEHMMVFTESTITAV